MRRDKRERTLNISFFMSFPGVGGGQNGECHRRGAEAQEADRGHHKVSVCGSASGGYRCILWRGRGRGSGRGAVGLCRLSGAVVPTLAVRCSLGRAGCWNVHMAGPTCLTLRVSLQKEEEEQLQGRCLGDGREGALWQGGNGGGRLVARHSRHAHGLREEVGRAGALFQLLPTAGVLVLPCMRSFPSARCGLDAHSVVRCGGCSGRECRSRSWS